MPQNAGNTGDRADKRKLGKHGLREQNRNDGFADIVDADQHGGRPAKCDQCVGGSEIAGAAFTQVYPAAAGKAETA